MALYFTAWCIPEGKFRRVAWLGGSKPSNLLENMSDTFWLMEQRNKVRGYVDIRSLSTAASPGWSGKKLTSRQHEILTLLARGFYYKEIGAMLGISHATVRAHLQTAYRKLEVKSRARAVIRFHEYLQHQLG